MIEFYKMHLRMFIMLRHIERFIMQESSEFEIFLIEAEEIFNSVSKFVLSDKIV